MMTKIEKIFFLTIFLLSVAAGLGSYRMYAALHAYESLEGAQQTYHDFSSIMTLAVPSALVVLLVLSSVIFMQTDKMSYFMYAFLYFAVFTIVDYVVIGEMYFQFIKSNGLWKGGFSIMGLAGLFLCFCAFIIAASNYLILNTIKRIKNPKKPS